MDVDPSSAARPRPRFNDVTGGYLRPSASRTHSGQARAHPYHPGSSYNPQRPPTKAEIETKWNHDLFRAGSNLYSPQVNTGALSERGLNPASTPFEPPTPAPAPPPPAPAPAAAAYRVPTGPASDAVASRFGIRGSSSNAHAAKMAVAEEGRRKVEEERQRRAQRKEADRLKKEQEELRKNRSKIERIAQLEKRGFVVQVEGLVFGTSSDDVQTAFGQYGETSNCFIVNESDAKEGDSLTARLVFKIYDDAESACLKLNGAIADGRPLVVKQVPATPMPPADDEVIIPTGPKSKSLANTIRQTGPKDPVSSPAASLPPASKTMYADEEDSFRPPPPVATIPTGPKAARKQQAIIPAAPVPKASNIFAQHQLNKDRKVATTSMDVDMDVDERVPKGPRGNATNGRGGGGRGGAMAAGRGGATAGRGGGSLASRIALAPGEAPSGPKKGNSLLNRIK